MEMEEAFRRRLIDGYKADPNWCKISNVLDKQGTEDNAKLQFYRENDQILRSDEYTTGSHAYEPRRSCVPWPVIKDILDTAHDDTHLRTAIKKISASYYIRGLTRCLRDYPKHCPQCQIFQTRRHKPYGYLQPILTPPVPFHTINY